MRLIDADALKDYIDAQEGRPFIGCTIGEALKIMTDEQPTIQPKRGKWSPADSLHHGAPFYFCSECGEKMLSTVMGNPRWNFCPNCGAKMEVTDGRA